MEIASLAGIGCKYKKIDLSGYGQPHTVGGLEQADYDEVRIGNDGAQVEYVIKC